MAIFDIHIVRIVSLVSAWRLKCLSSGRLGTFIAWLNFSRKIPAPTLLYYIDLSHKCFHILAPLQQRSCDILRLRFCLLILILWRSRFLLWRNFILRQIKHENPHSNVYFKLTCFDFWEFLSSFFFSGCRQIYRQV